MYEKFSRKEYTMVHLSRWQRVWLEHKSHSISCTPHDYGLGCGWNMLTGKLSLRSPHWPEIYPFLISSQHCFCHFTIARVRQIIDSNNLMSKWWYIYGVLNFCYQITMQIYSWQMCGPHWRKKKNTFPYRIFEKNANKKLQYL